MEEHSSEIGESINLEKRELIIDDLSFLGIYHENSLDDFSLVHLGEEAHEVFGMTMDKLKVSGGNFLMKIVHPNDREYFFRQVMSLKRKRSTVSLSCFLRLRFYQEAKYNLGLINVTMNKSREVFQCVTSPVTQVNEFASITKQVLNKRTYQNKYFHVYSSLSPREREIIALVCMGESSTDIAEKLFLSAHTVKAHRRNVKNKTSFNDAELIEFALNFNLIDV